MLAPPYPLTERVATHPVPVIAITVQWDQINVLVTCVNGSFMDVHACDGLTTVCRLTGRVRELEATEQERLRSEQLWKDKCNEYRERAAELQDTVENLKVRVQRARGGTA